MPIWKKVAPPGRGNNPGGAELLPLYAWSCAATAAVIFMTWTPAAGPRQPTRNYSATAGMVLNHSILPMPKMQTPVPPVLSQVNANPGVKHIPFTANPSLEKSNCSEVFAAMVQGPIKGVKTAAPLIPSPMVIPCAPAPLFMQMKSTIILNPAAGAAFKISAPEISAEVALMIKPNFLACGVVIEIAIIYPSKKRPEGSIPPARLNCLSPFCDLYQPARRQAILRGQYFRVNRLSI